MALGAVHGWPDGESSGATRVVKAGAILFPLPLRSTPDPNPLFRKNKHE
jgi:hypothetical protein